MRRLLWLVLIWTWVSPDPAGAVLLDLQADDLEVTQSIQDKANSVALIEGKRTYVRLHAHANNTFKVDGVGALLFAVRLAPVNETLGVVGPLNPGSTVDVRSTPQRNQIDDSFLFEIPEDWRSGTVRFTGTVDNPGKIQESNENNNSVEVVVIFDPAPPLRLRMYNVDYPTGQPPTLLDKVLIYWWLSSAYPTATVSMQHRALPTAIDWGSDVCTCTNTNMEGNCTDGFCVNDNGHTCTADRDCGCGRLNDMLTTFRTVDSWTSPQTFHPDARYYALVHDAGGFMRGCSPGTTFKVAAGPTGVPPAEWAWDTDPSYGDWYTAHELGHATGRPHAPCCGASGSDFFPHASCRISDGDIWGFNTINREIYSSFWTDVMSYCDDQWISAFTYNALRNQLTTDSGETLPGPGTTLNDLVFLEGRVNLDTLAAELQPAVHIQTLQPAPVPGSIGPYSLAFVNATGGSLSETFFDLVDTYDTSAKAPSSEVIGSSQFEPFVSFAQVLPVVPGAVGLQLRHMGLAIASHTASANPPTVTLTAPNGGENVGPNVAVTWTASDLDLDPLTAMLQYSSDAGSSWSTLAFGLDAAAGAANVDLAGRPGSSQALFKILVSDGYYGAADQSDAVFETANDPPFLVILSPFDSQVYPGAANVLLEASASDAEDGELNDTDVTWVSSRSGPLGSGLAVDAGSLPPGSHYVTATAADSDGGITEQTVYITVGVQAVPALSMRITLLAAAAGLAALALLALRRAR